MNETYTELCLSWLGRELNINLLGMEVSRGPVPDPKTRGLEVRYRTPSQSYEDCLGVR